MVCGVSEQVDFPLLHGDWLPSCEEVDFALDHAAGFNVRDRVFSCAVFLIGSCNCLGGGFFVSAVKCPDLFPSCVLGSGLLLPWGS